MSFSARLKTTLFTASTASLLAACATGPTQYAERSLSAQEQERVIDAADTMQPLYRALYAEGRRNEVLNLMEIGAQHFHEGRYDEAERAFDVVIAEIESVYADNDAARRARSLWYEEAEKDFKGEPYERAMAFYYRGLLFLRSGDFDNARASFISGLIQDAFAEEEQYSADFALFLYLAGWAALQMGSPDLAEEHFNELRAFRPDFIEPAAEHNVLAILETGTSPRKLADGVGHYELVYRRGRGFEEDRAALTYNGTTLPAYPMEDIFFQASTRGGREVDRIIDGQVQFKRSTESFGTTLSSVSANSTVQALGGAAGGSMPGVLGGLTAISVGAMSLSAQANPRADTRYWQRLPDTVHVVTFRADPDKSEQVVSAHFLNNSGRIFPELERTARIHFTGSSVGLVHASSRHP